jgi:hypothetical protein
MAQLGPDVHLHNSPLPPFTMAVGVKVEPSRPRGKTLCQIETPFAKCSGVHASDPATFVVYPGVGVNRCRR